MNEQEQHKACAELDGYQFMSGDFDPELCWRELSSSHPCRLPNYSTRDAVLGVIKKQFQSVGQQADFICSLANAVGTKSIGTADQYFMLVTATPAQLREALLRATGKWI